MAEILNLNLVDVVPDPNQPRRHFDQSAMVELRLAIQRWGQLSPIWVRRVDGRFVIVNGERRWRALQDLHKRFPQEVRFSNVKAVEYEGQQLDANDLLAVQLLVNSTAEDLTPTEKALVIRELQVSDGTRPSDAALQDQFGISKGQLRHARALADAPAFIQAFGLPQFYEHPVSSVQCDGEGKPRSFQAPPLGMSLLAELITLYNKLHAYDAKAFRETNGTHKVVAEAETRKLGAGAQRDCWSKSQLQARCTAAFRRCTSEVRPTKPGAKAQVGLAVERLHMVLEKALTGPEDELDYSGLTETLRALIARIESSQGAKEQPAA